MPYGNDGGRVGIPGGIGGPGGVFGGGTPQTWGGGGTGGFFGQLLYQLLMNQPGLGYGGLQQGGMGGPPQYYGPQQGGYNVPSPRGYSGYFSDPLSYWGQGFAGGRDTPQQPRKQGAPQQGRATLQQGRGYSPAKTRQPKYWGLGFSGR